MLHTKFRVDSQTSVHFPPKNGSEFFAFATAPPVCAVAVAFMCEIFSGVCYLTLQRGVTDTARHRVNITCRGVTGTARMLHTLTHSSISRQLRQQM